MNQLLWVLAVVGAINTFAVFSILFLRMELPAYTNTSRFIDGIYTLVLMIWAICLLARQGG
jgi:hypothetical protein